MGSSVYSYSSRSLRADKLDYVKASIDTTFTQNKLGMIHESMDPKKATIREARDSDVHPHTVPIILELDVTGSMRQIPHELIKTGLPTLVSKIIQAGIPDPALLFLAVGDHEYDRHPLQVGQFESGDAELDMWLTRSYLEGGGGGNAGESYPLGWYFAAKHTATDAWDKRKEKGFYISVGDEPFLKNFPGSAMKELYAGEQFNANYTAAELYALVSERWNVYHINMAEHREMDKGWKDLLGQKAIDAKSYADVPKIIADLIIDNAGYAKHSGGSLGVDASTLAPEKIIL